MAVTVTGFQGTVSDAQMATMYPHHVPAVGSSADLAVAAVAGARSVSVAAGTAYGPFLKYTSDAAQTLTLAPPASGGKWYAVTINRQWSPTNTAVLQADDLGVSDANGTIPTTVPASVITAANALPNQPGTAGSTAGQRQLLALVYVRAADTTLTIFDLRVARTGGGTLALPSIHALAVLLAYFQDGAVVSVSQAAPLATAVILKQSLWQRVGGAWQPAPGTAPVVTGGTNLSDNIGGLMGLFALQQAYSAQMGWPQGQRARDIAGFEYAWARAGATWTLEPGPLTRCVLRSVGNPGAWPDNTSQALGFDTAQTDPMGMWTTGDNRRIKYPVAGRYRHTMAAASNGGDVANVEFSVPVYLADGATYDHRGPSSFHTYLKSDKPARCVQESQVPTAGMTSYFWAYRNDGNSGRGFSYGDRTVWPEWVIEYVGPLGS